MAERRAGTSAEISLAVGSGAAVALNAAVGRADLERAFPLRVVQRNLPDGSDVSLPLSIRDGTFSFTVLRTVEADKLLCGANQKLGTATLRPQGTGKGLPQRVAPVVITTAFTATGGQLATWRLTLTLNGAVTDSVQ